MVIFHNLPKIPAVFLQILSHYKHEGYLHPPENEYPSLQKAFRKTVPDHSDKQDGDHLQELRSEPLCFPRVFFPEAPGEMLPSDDDLWIIR